ncbi:MULTISPECIES: hypothetical protein [Kordiimonas]|jgi:hypothetical protein|uniref:hypothetical protein n=1 Tax=Kordiimonas TaxID=288021 RepID=UPI002580F265|nr:hypothetical protein [Kordiimonas sp. UBA4487]
MNRTKALVLITLAFLTGGIVSYLFFPHWTYSDTPYEPPEAVETAHTREMTSHSGGPRIWLDTPARDGFLSSVTTPEPSLSVVAFNPTLTIRPSDLADKCIYYAGGADLRLSLFPDRQTAESIEALARLSSREAGTSKPYMLLSSPGAIHAVWGSNQDWIAEYDTMVAQSDEPDNISGWNRIDLMEEPQHIVDTFRHIIAWSGGKKVRFCRKDDEARVTELLAVASRYMDAEQARTLFEPTAKPPAD